ncbi:MULTISPECIES: DUF3800 domain-containing protein [unclassified Wenzhouxiangella]|uniref:DUF3800 domain-containing protein n=1 Tax=unclassified Wenzhouxiangella TaxID=2613841 RepID=UPI000E32874B|nr:MULTISPECIES: DUF3800 domain-containing protein [unclassified Wenzhouxiangella]RFF26892.1 DUF3800 domain-containing protein [Wenzhouxiangella sp. 15181]RFP68453.1 DUF3800 domain-containing protein [Wenzhouxiangella sp. 15190]
MKFCYFDESGTGDQPISVMAGVVADAHRMHLTKDTWSGLLGQLSDIVGQPVREFHSRKFYSGSGIWKGLDGPHRASIISAIVKWMKDRKHKVVYSALDIQRYEEKRNEDARFEGLSAWRTMALHVALSVQRRHQGESKNKGHTVLVFDEQVKEKDRFTDLILNPPEWTDEYYERKRGRKALDQLVDVPHFVDSKQVELVQVADLYAFILRRQFELETGLDEAKYTDERNKVGAWAEDILSQTIGNGHIYPKKQPSDAAQLFRSVAPECCI